MQITRQGHKYVAQSSFAEKDIVKSAGWRWDPQARQWWTDDIARAARLAQYAIDCPELTEVNRDAQMSRESSADDIIDLPRPNGLDYLPFQKVGISLATKRQNCLIADEMGLGKTIQAIGVINADPSIKKVLVICPASLRINWRRELQKWLVREMSIGTCNGSWPETDIVIINYDILTKWSAQTHAIEWDLVIADEAHYLKNPESQRSEQVLGSSYKKRRNLAHGR